MPALLGTLTRKTRDGTARWNFICDDERYYAVNERTRKVLACKNRDELRDLYRKFRSWNFTPLTD